jgi:hypothetical protein
MSGLRKKANQIKRCMNHIFEFYEETFPEHSLNQLNSLNSAGCSSNPTSQGSSEKS